MSKEENTELLALKRKKKRVENAINSQSKRLKTTKDNGGNTSSVDRTLKNSKEALVRIDAEIKKCEPIIDSIGRDVKKKLPKGLIILLIALVGILVLTLTGVI